MTAVTTSSTTFVDVPSMSATITVTVPSMLIITFSAQAKVDVNGNYLCNLAMVDSLLANPDSPTMILASSTSWSQYSTAFWLSVAAGTHVVHIQWKVASASSSGEAFERTLTVIALPT